MTTVRNVVKPAAPAPAIRTLTPQEVRQVAGAPMGAPTLGQTPPNSQSNGQ